MTTVEGNILREYKLFVANRHGHKSWLDLENSCVRKSESTDKFWMEVLDLWGDYHQREGIKQFARLDEPWPTVDILSKLIEASNILLHVKSYDGPNYEEINHAVSVGQLLVDLLVKKT